MDNQENIEKSYELPAPTSSVESQQSSGAEYGSFNESKTNASGGGPLPPVSAAQQQASAQAQSGNQPTADPSTATSTTTGLSAADVDLIEKVWVQKAKEIVAKTTGDPYTQNKEINKIKADYIKKRYNKDIKLASE